MGKKKEKRSRPIVVKIDEWVGGIPPSPPLGPLEIGGWYDGNHTYVHFSVNGKCVGTLSGRRLLRFAEKLVKGIKEGPQYQH